MGKDVLRHHPITLRWSPWVRWTALSAQGYAVISEATGVYEARAKWAKGRRLAVGQSDNLRRRVRQLVRGRNHSAGKRIAADIRSGRFAESDLSVRWAMTDHAACAEAALHCRHRERFGDNPEHVRQ